MRGLSPLLVRKDIFARKDISVREAVPGDEALVLSFVQKLAAFEGLSDCVTATVEDFRRDLFDRHIVSAAFAHTVHTGHTAGTEDISRAVGFVLYFLNYSSFRGTCGLYVEDLFVDEDFRGKGVARELFAFLASKAREQGCSRLEWSVLGWNDNAKRFYSSLGGSVHEGWEIWRLEV